MSRFRTSLRPHPSRFLLRLVLGVLFVNLFVASLVVVSLRQSRRHYEERTAVQTQNLAGALEESIAGIIHQTDLTLLDVLDEARREMTSGGLRPEVMNAFLARRQARLPDLEGIRLADARGEIVCGTGIQAGFVGSVADRDYFMRLRTDVGADLVISKPVKGRVSGKWVIIVARRFSAEDGSFAGAVWGTITVEQFSHILSPIDIGRHGGISLRDADMAIIARNPAPRDISSIIGNRVLSPEMRAALAADGSNGTFYTPTGWDNVARTVTYRRIGRYPLYVVVGLAASEYLADWRSGVAKMAALTVLFCAATLLFSRHAYLNWKREREAEEELRRSKVELEVRVEERTAALNDANLKLQEELAERMQAERCLRESEENLRSLLHSMPAGVVWADEEGRIEYVNRYFTRHFGYTLEDLPTVDDWFRRAFSDEEVRARYLERQEEGIREALARREETVPSWEAKVTCRDGSVRHVIINNRVKKGCVLAIFTDITEREQMAEQLLKIQKLESLGLLAGGIAHDFNNILTAIMGNISLAQRRLDEGHRALQPLARAEKGAERAAQLADQLLTFAKGGLPVKQAVSLRRLVEETLSLALHGTSVTGSIEFAEGVHAVEADEGQLSQALTNIVLNAVQAMPKGGRLTARGENAAVSGRDDLAAGDYVRLSFTDEGCGIGEENLPRIFDPYFTTRPGGTGLGLASTHSIVTKHGGQILVDSGVGRGTTFTLYLPAYSGAAGEERAPGTGGRAAAAAGTVLVMDDEEMIRLLTADMLTELGYDVATCCSGEEAIAAYAAARAQGRPFAAVIMDLTVPGAMGGKEAAAGILALDPAARLVVSSGYSSAALMAYYRACGFRAAVVKPYTLEQLGGVLQEVMADATRPAENRPPLPPLHS